MIRIAVLSLFALAACEPHVPSSRYLSAPFELAAVDAARLDGLWYEVAAFPTPFQKICSHTTVAFEATGDGRLSVRNRCRATDQAGVTYEVAGVATPAGPGQWTTDLNSTATLAGAYWVLDMSRDGRTLVLGTPDRLAGWVLHRDADISPFERDAARDVFDRNGYDVAALQRTRQR